MGETFTGLSGKTKEDFGHGEAKFITYMNVFSNTIANKNMVEQVEIDNSQNKVMYGDVLFTTSSETPNEVGMSSVWLENVDNTYLNSFCFGYRPNEKMDSHYLAYTLRADSFRNDMTLLAQGISRYNISKTKAMNLKVSLPKLAEQTKIGTFFATLDNLITCHQRKYDKLVNVKKSMLEKMFPKNGEKTPEIRFDGFTDDWEQRELKKFSEFITKGTTPLDKTGNGNINFIKIENIDSSSGNIIPSTKITYEEHTNHLKRSQLKENDILFSIAGTLGRVTSVNKELLPANTNQALAIIRLENGDLEYIKTYLKGQVVSEFVRKNPTIGAQPNLSLEQVANLQIKYPQIEEQTKIGTFFATLDNLITCHQRKPKKEKKCL